MTQLQRVLILLMVAGIPAAAPPVPGSSPTLCLAAGSFTYRVWPNAAAADLRIKIDPRAAAPDLRIELVDSIEGADFAVVDEREQADITISLSRDDPAADLRLYVHSMRFGHRDAAALLAAMRHYEHAGKHPAHAEDTETSW